MRSVRIQKPQTATRRARIVLGGRVLVRTRGGKQASSGGVRRCPTLCSELGGGLPRAASPPPHGAAESAPHTRPHTSQDIPEHPAPIGTNGPAQVARMATASAGDAAPSEDPMVRRHSPLLLAVSVSPTHSLTTRRTCAKAAPRCLGCVLTPSPESGRHSYHLMLRHDHRRPHPRN